MTHKIQKQFEKMHQMKVGVDFQMGTLSHPYV